MDEDSYKPRTRDVFTTALLKRAAKNLGVKFNDSITPFQERVIIDELENIKKEIRTRESVLGVEDSSLIPLFVKAGDLVTTRESALSYYQRALDVVELNKPIKGDSLGMNEITVLNYANLGSRLFKHGEYEKAQNIFILLATICREKTYNRFGIISSFENQQSSLNDLHRLQSNLQDLKSNVKMISKDINNVHNKNIVKSQEEKGKKDTFTQTEIIKEVKVVPFNRYTISEENKKKTELKGLRNARDLEKLVEYVFNPANVNDSITTQMIVRERNANKNTLPEPKIELTPFLALQKSLDRITLKTDETPSIIGTENGVARKLL